MAAETMETTLKRFDERYYKMRVDAVVLERFGTNLKLYVEKIRTAASNGESEEHLKNIVNSFLKFSFYQNDRFEINTYRRADSAIKFDDTLYAIIEMKKPSNVAEMLRENDINHKALWEIVFYYLLETRSTDGPRVKTKYGSEVRRLIVTDGKKWFLINAQDLNKICQGYIEKLFYKFQNHQLTYSDVDSFYAAIHEYFDEIDITEKLQFVYFEMENVLSRRSQWQYLFKILRKDYLLKDGYKQIVKTHVLNKGFYQELLYLMGLKEEKQDGKNVIFIDHSIHNSLASQVYKILNEEKEKPVEEATEETFQLVLIWINRLLFIKLFEGQLIEFNGDEPKYRILDNEKIHSFAEVQTLFFDILGRKERERSPFLDQFISIPYLNSSLFERYDIEKQDVNIREIRNDSIVKKPGSILGKRAPDAIPLLEYFISFLNAYSFTAVNTNVEDTQFKTSEIIDASVLGLIFEKINGYKEGSFYTKGFVTEYICQEAIESTIVKKLNKAFNWHCKSVDDLKLSIDYNSAEQIKKINEIINGLHICDPAVGSGHFLVSALNRIISLKRELGVLMKYGTSSPLREYDIAVIDDVLCVFDGQGKEFKYKPDDFLSQSIQKTLFHEKRTIIENCLFGVDINPNAVAICQLRLWIELLKNAYYENGTMETLPNIDINIKCGNSLVHIIRFAVGNKISAREAGLRRGLLADYKFAVKQYHSESDKSEKQRIKRLLNTIKQSLHAACAQLRYDVSDNDIHLTDDAEWSLNRYSNAFEWAIEFPEVLSDDGVYLGFDCVIGNPPYIRVQELQHDDIDYYKKKYETAWQRIDISTMFIELGYNLVNKDGSVSYITSNQFLTADYGRRMRDYLSRKHFVKKIVEFADLPVFDGALTYVSIFFFVKERATREFGYYKVPSLPFIPPTDNQLIKFTEEEMSTDEGWILRSKQIRECMEKLKAASPDVLSKYAKCWSGAFTGKDDILMFANDQVIPFEEEMTIPVIRAEGCERYSYAQPSRKIYYPYVDRGDETELLAIEEIENQYPETYDYIMTHEEELKSRKDSRKTFGQKQGWYGLVRFGKLSRFRKPKVVSPGEVKRNKFSLDLTGAAFSCGRVFSITSENSNVSIKYLLGFLNSKICEFYLHNTAALKAGGYYAYSSTVIDALPFVFKADRAEAIEETVEKILTSHQNGESTDSLENELDKEFYDLFGINETEQRTIEQYLEM